ncbi:S49 family peptidase [Profundibacterium mesophilum]|uniref:Peptidase family S49 n=1 Tax=Profundibacterium mesophilum KAUST100406-0324 TaxID=1037889 RepID=A0A921NR82_9RHOB|nr:S49 family peptidase [Profundibacterium mesophilum]KAF0675992.1 Peptidase family S49 [Profundibacterium mesophilum KAUST100406-0324]
MKRFIPFLKSGPLVSVIRLQGMIASSGPNRLNDATLAPVIEKAFRRGKPSGVALVLNSPGGSPAQSALIAARIRRLGEEKGVPVLAFVEDVAASGGYWLATAADEIYADETSIVGSIGVISAGFGFDELIRRHGIERRVYTAGNSKSTLDPFAPEKTEDVARLRRLQEQIHGAFIDQVKRRRGGKLTSEIDLFNGEFWIGQTAVELGLIDGIGHMVPVLKKRFGPDLRLANYQQRRPFLSRFGAGLADSALSTIETRIAAARYGL